MSDHDWRRRALCAGMDVEEFFPHSPDLVTEEAAKACRACLVTEACLEWSQTLPEVYGTWAGLSENERLELRNPGWRGRKMAQRRRESVAS